MLDFDRWLRAALYFTCCLWIQQQKPVVIFDRGLLLLFRNSHKYVCHDELFSLHRCFKHYSIGNLWICLIDSISKKDRKCNNYSPLYVVSNGHMGFLNEVERQNRFCSLPEYTHSVLSEEPQLQPLQLAVKAVTLFSVCSNTLSSHNTIYIGFLWHSLHFASWIETIPPQTGQVYSICCRLINSASPASFTAWLFFIRLVP